MSHFIEVRDGQAKNWFRNRQPPEPTRIEFDAERLEEQMAVFPLRSARGIVDRWICAGLTHFERIELVHVRIFGTCAICGERRHVKACAECDRDVCAVIDGLCGDCALVAAARRNRAVSVATGAL